MFGIRYMKATPTTYVLLFKNGQVRREGAGLSFFYYAPTSTLVTVPLASVDVPFVFNEVSADFQELTLQGQLAFRVADARKLAALMDFSILPKGGYKSDDPEMLKERLVRLAQIQTRAIVQLLPLREALRSADALERDVLTRLKSSEMVTMLGIEVIGVSVLSIRPTPEMARALEAEAREELQRRADDAIYGRRNAAVEQERRIKENELNTELAVEAKQRQIRESRMAADVAVEQQRAALIESRAENDRKDADAKAYALDAMVRPLREMDWRVLTSIAAGGNNPGLNIALAFRELAENAQKIGELNMTPELLNNLIRGRDPRNG